MKHNLIRYSMIVLMFGLIALTASRANAQTDQKYIELLSYSLGFATGETARISVTLRRLANPDQPPINARIQLLDTEGRVIAQSDEIKTTAHSRSLFATLTPAGRNREESRLEIETTIFALRSRSG